MTEQVTGEDKDQPSGASTKNVDPSAKQAQRHKPGSFGELIQASPGQSVLRWLWWHLLRGVCWLWFKIFFRWRVHNGHRFPRTGAVLIVANHQSFLDPIAVGLATGARPMCSLARSSLFKGPLSWVYHSVNTIPVERGKSDTKAMRICLDVLKNGYPLVLFPEGTRSKDGQVGEFKGGIMLMIKRAKPTVITLAIDGSHDTWPANRKLPKLFGKVTGYWGEPIEAETLLAMSNTEALELLRGQVVDLMKK